MKVLVACEESQAVCKAFRLRGHEAYSCDLSQCSGGHPEWHIMCDVIKILNGKSEDVVAFVTQDGTLHNLPDRWDLIIAHPPCTFLSNAGARWLYENGILNTERYKKGCIAKMFFMQFINANCEKIVVENPIPSKVFHLPNYTQIIQPYEYGHPYSKKRAYG